MLVDFEARDLTEVVADARVDHRGGQPRGFLWRHTTAQSCHKQRRRLIVGQRAVSDPVDEKSDLVAGQHPAIAFSHDDVDRAHPAGSILVNRASSPPGASPERAGGARAEMKDSGPDTEYLNPQDSARLTEIARACKAAARAVVLYPNGHPSVGSTLGRIVDWTAPAHLDAPLTIMVLPDALVIDGKGAQKADSSI